MEPGRTRSIQMWMIVTVISEAIWPDRECSFTYLNREVTLRPSTPEYAADIRIQYIHPDEEGTALETISRFLSGIAWQFQRPVRPHLRFACTSPMRGGHNQPGPHLAKGFYLPEDFDSPLEPKSRIALALFREAISEHSIPFQFLGYFKIINLMFESGAEQKDWINRNVHSLTDLEAQERIRSLTKTESNIGQYLYVSGRCAVAHAFSDPVVDPDNPADTLRLEADMPVMRQLANRLIEQELNMAR